MTLEVIMNWCARSGLTAAIAFLGLSAGDAFAQPRLAPEACPLPKLIETVSYTGPGGSHISRVRLGDIRVLDTFHLVSTGDGDAEVRSLPEPADSGDEHWCGQVDLNHHPAPETAQDWRNQAGIVVARRGWMLRGDLEYTAEFPDTFAKLEQDGQITGLPAGIYLAFSWPQNAPGFDDPIMADLIREISALDPKDCERWSLHLPDVILVGLCA